MAIKLILIYEPNEYNPNEVKFEGTYAEESTWAELFTGFVRGLGTLGYFPNKTKFHDAVDDCEYLDAK